MKNKRLKICSYCGRIFYHGTWKKIDFDDIIRKEYNLKDFNVIYPKNKGPGIRTEIIVEYHKGKETIQVPIKVMYTVCDRCRKKTSTYYEGILQLRNADKDIIDFVNKRIKQDDIFVSKKISKGKNIDLYLGSRKFITNIGKELDKRFNGQLKISRKIVGRNKQKGRDIYRVNVVFKRYNFKIGQILEYKGRKIKIKNIGKFISGIDINTNKKVSIKADELIRAL